MIDIRAHGGQFGGGKYRKGMILGGFRDVILENKILIAKTADSSYGSYNPSINLNQNYIFFVGGNAQNVQLRKFDLTTGAETFGDIINQPEGSLVDVNGNSYVIYKDALRKMNPNLVGYVWSIVANMIGYDMARTRGGWNKKDPKNSTSTHLYFCTHWSPYYVYKIDIQTGAVTNITPVGNSQRVNAFEVHEDLNAIYAIKGSSLMKLDLNWNIIWEVTLSVSGQSPDTNYSSLSVDKKSGHVFAIWGTSGGLRYVWKVDYNGNVVEGEVNITTSPYNLVGNISNTQLFEVVDNFLFIGDGNKIRALKTSNLNPTSFEYTLQETSYQAIKFVNGDTLHVGSTGNYRKYLNRIELL